MFTSDDMIKPEDLPGVSEDAARRIIAVARSIAPCISSLPAFSEERNDAVAILRGVAAELQMQQSRLIASQAVASARVSYRSVRSAFLDDDRDALTALCSGSVRRAGGPVGSFPVARPLGNVWPEGPYA